MEGKCDIKECEGIIGMENLRRGENGRN